MKKEKGKRKQKGGKRKMEEGRPRQKISFPTIPKLPGFDPSLR